jgi:hypothetical protein
MQFLDAADNANIHDSNGGPAEQPVSIFAPDDVWDAAHGRRPSESAASGRSGGRAMNIDFFGRVDGIIQTIFCTFFHNSPILERFLTWVEFKLQKIQKSFKLNSSLGKNKQFQCKIIVAK